MIRLIMNVDIPPTRGVGTGAPGLGNWYQPAPNPLLSQPASYSFQPPAFGDVRPLACEHQPLKKPLVLC